MRRIRLIVPILCLAMAACGKSPDATAPTVASTIALADATVQLPAVPGRPAAAYFVLTPGNAGGGKLVGVTVAHFARAEMHQSKMVGSAMTMEPVDSLPLAPGKPIVFAPGGYHVMLFDGDGTLKPGGHADLTIKLDTGATITALAKVTAAGGDDMTGM